MSNGCSVLVCSLLCSDAHLLFLLTASATMSLHTWR